MIASNKTLFLIAAVPCFLAGTIYAAGIFPSISAPEWNFSSRITNISGSCSMSGADNQFLKWFNADYTKKCVSPDGGTELTIASPPAGNYPLNPPSWELSWGKFGTYFKNFQGTCSGTGVIKGLTTQGQKICTNTSAPAPIPLWQSSISWPNNPSWETWGNYKSFFDNMFTNTCGANEALIGFSPTWTQICAPFHVDGACDTSEKFKCQVGTSIAHETGSCDGSTTWTCSGKNWGNAVSCSMPNDATLCRFVTTTFTSSARRGTSSIGVWIQKRCVLTSIWGDAWDYSYYNVIGLENSNWSFQISDEWKKHSAYGSILCTKEVTSWWSPTEWSSCVHNGVSGIKLWGICYVGSYSYAPGGSNMGAY